MTSRANISSIYMIPDNLFYWINNTPVTYTVFTFSIVTILAHIGSIALNSLMIEAIRRSRKIDEPNGHCLIALAGAYIWHALNMIYNGVYGLVNMQDENECLIRFGFLHSSFIIISWTKCLLTFDRYLQIEFTFWYKKHIHNHTIWIMSTVIGVSAVFYGLSMWMFGWYIPLEGTTRNNFCEHFNVVPALHVQIVYLVTFMGLPFTIVIYVRLLWIANRRKGSLRKFKGQMTSNKLNAEKIRQKKWKPIKLVLAISVVCFAGWAAPGVFGLVSTFDPAYPKMVWKNHALTGGLLLIPSISGVINAFLYTMHREVKLRFFQLLGCQRCIKSNESAKKAMLAYTIHSRNLNANTKTPTINTLASNLPNMTTGNKISASTSNDLNYGPTKKYSPLLLLESPVKHSNHIELPASIPTAEEPLAGQEMIIDHDSGDSSTNVDKSFD